MYHPSMPNTTDRASLTIAGMHCGNCVAKVARAITTVPGVEVESLSIGHAVVQFDPARAAAADIVAAVARAGYSAQVADGAGD
jgi:copper chaperone CopZ